MDIEKDQTLIVSNPRIFDNIARKKSRPLSVSGNFHDFTIVGTAAKLSLNMAKIIEIPKL